MKAISKSSLADHITVKVGVVMRSITGDARRATQNMDLDFIRYSLEEESIRRFIGRLNYLDGISIHISAPIEELSQQEHHGKRIFVMIKDSRCFSDAFPMLFRRLISITIKETKKKRSFQKRHTAPSRKACFGYSSLNSVGCP